MKINGKAPLLLFMTLALLVARPLAAAAPEQVARTRLWHLLLHDRPGSDHSEAAGPAFFFSPVGARDPLAELQATLEAFRAPAATQNGFFNQHPQCAFPARLHHLLETLDVVWTKNIAIEPCVEFNQWKKRLKPRSITLVYADGYLGRPASTFGHTFLRLDSAVNALLDNGISFDAHPGPTRGMGYVIEGLTGGYPGTFSLQPYYLKIKTYSDLENRDLWEYNLNLKLDEIERLIDHLWELTNTHFPYYFLNGNCSYHLLSLLEVAHPGWHLRDHFHLYAIPLDTARAVTMQEGAVAAVHRRPSLYHRLETARLEGDLDAPILLDQFKNKGDVTPRTEALLQARAQEPAPPKPPPPSPPAPTRGPSSTKLTLGAASQNGRREAVLALRPALHDWLENETGAIPYSTLTVLESQWRYGRQLTLQNFTLARLVNLAPVNELQRAPSWLIGLDLYRPEDLNCIDCVAARLQAGAGYSSRPWPSVLFYGLVKAQGEYSRALAAGDRYGPSLEAGGHFTFSQNLKGLLRVEEFFYFPDEDSVPSVSGTLAYGTAHSEIRLGVQWIRQFAEATLTFSWFL